jgi:hypothetical protein
MANYQKNGTRFTGQKFLMSLAVWFVVCLILYSFINIQENMRTRELILTGVTISKDISSQSGLPLLEKNFDLLGSFLENITERPEVLFASIIDHKNKLIAYTDQVQLLSLKKQKFGVMENVSYWRISDLNNRRVMNFSSEITFSDTRVGEVFISLSAENMGWMKRSFAHFTIITLVILLVMFGAARYRDCLLWLNAKSAQLIAKGSHR